MTQRSKGVAAPVQPVFAQDRRARHRMSLTDDDLAAVAVREHVSRSEPPRRHHRFAHG